MLKSIGIVLGSYVLSVILVLCTDPILTRIFPGDFERGHIPSNPALIASTACFVVVSIFCAWLCARFAPRNPAKHVLWFFALGEAMGLGFIFPTGPKAGPTGTGSPGFSPGPPVRGSASNSLVEQAAAKPHPLP